MRLAACWSSCSGMAGQLQPVSCSSLPQEPAIDRLPITQMAGACGFLVALKMTLQTHCQAFMLSAKVPVDHVAQCTGQDPAAQNLGSNIHLEHKAQEAHLSFAPDSQSMNSVLQAQCRGAAGLVMPVWRATDPAAHPCSRRRRGPKGADGYLRQAESATRSAACRRTGWRNGRAACSGQAAVRAALPPGNAAARACRYSISVQPVSSEETALPPIRQCCFELG